MIHLYIGYGKGKTSAAMGSVLRMTGCGKKTAVVQFFKSGESSEISVLQKLPGVTYFNLEQKHGFYHFLSEYEKENVSVEISSEFELAEKLILSREFDMIVLDEVVDAVCLGIIEEKQLVSLLQKADSTEIILTGHKPLQPLIDIADYYTEFICHKHPYQNGVKARKGIEF
ncbi:MAG: cob(I)yrinic acid a,c-diamide adenosyltransferase [Bacillota bacterium]|nr:cob(I)yrinic acid a,c-diamide adenosyltransferase [Bacillota bacterium]